jgi:hypothetical protein
MLRAWPAADPRTGPRRPPGSLDWDWSEWPADLTPPETMSEALMKDWLDLFVELALAGPDG